MRSFRTSSLIAALIFATPAAAQQWIQLPSCGGAIPSGINPSAATISVNPSGQLCTAGSATVSISTPLSINIPQVGAVVSGAYADGAINTIGQRVDPAAGASTTSGSVISYLRGILANVITPISVSGSFSSTATGQNITQVASQQIASPSTYGVAPVGSVLGVNAFVTSLPGTPLNVTIGGPTPLQITLPASPIGVGVTNSPTVVLSGSPVSVGIAGPTPLNVTVSGSPVNVTLPTPLNVTVATSPLNVTQIGQSGQNFNLVQWQGVTVASASTYGVAPVGSVGAVNAFVTNNVNVTTPTPLGVTFPASPISVGIAGPTPLNITIASTPLNVTFPASPISVGIAGPTPLNVTLVASPLNVTQSQTWTATQINNVTNSSRQIGPTGAHQLGKVVCDGQSGSWGFLVLFDVATSGAVTLGTTQPKEFLPLAPSALNGFVNTQPGDIFNNGISVAVVTTVPTGSSALGTFVNCSFSYQ